MECVRKNLSFTNKTRLVFESLYLPLFFSALEDKEIKKRDVSNFKNLIPTPSTMSKRFLNSLYYKSPLFVYVMHVWSPRSQFGQFARLEISSQLKNSIRTLQMTDLKSFILFPEQVFWKERKKSKIQKV